MVMSRHLLLRSAHFLERKPAGSSLLRQPGTPAPQFRGHESVYFLTSEV